MQTVNGSFRRRGTWYEIVSISYYTRFSVVMMNAMIRWRNSPGNMNDYERLMAHKNTHHTIANYTAWNGGLHDVAIVESVG